MVGEASSQAVRSAREVSETSRSSQMIRKVQRRPSRSSSAMIGRPEREPRTAGFFGIAAGFAIKALLRNATDIVASCYVYCSTGADDVTGHTAPRAAGAALCT